MAVNRAGDVLVLRALGLGDFLTAVPALRALQRHMPDHRHHLAAPAGLTPLLPLAGLRHTIIDCLGPGPIRGSRRPPELAVNLHGSGPESHRALLDTSPGRLFAFERADLDVSGPAWVEDEPEIRRWCRLLEWNGVPAFPDDLHIHPPATGFPQARGATVIHPGAKDPARRWPVERFAAVARHEAAHGRRVLVTGSAEETRLASELTRLAKLPASANWAGRTDLAQLAAIIAEADTLVCGDTGVAHLATAVETPSVLLFGPTDPARWGPPSGPHVVLWKGLLGDAHGASPHRGLMQIGVDEVVESLTRLRDRADSHFLV